MGGRPPKSAHLMLKDKGKLYGTEKARLALEPHPERDLKPRCPKEFTPAERKHWRVYAAILGNLGLFEVGNAGALKRLAILWTIYDDYRNRFYELHGQLTEGHVSGIAKNPFLRELKAVGREIREEERELGVPPAARAKLGTLTLKAIKEKEEFFND